MRKSGVETFRFIAIVAVIVIHVYPTDHLSGQILNQLSRFAVPYFFIISGYFFYKKVAGDVNRSSNYFLQYGLRLIYIYAFWYLIYAYWPLVSPENWQNILENGFIAELHRESAGFLAELKDHMLYYLFAGGRADHLWFLPSLGAALVLLFISIRLKMLMAGSIFALALFFMALLLDPYNKTTLALAIPFHVSGRNGPFFSSIFVFAGALFAKFDVRASTKVALAFVISGIAIHMTEVFYLKNTYNMPLITSDYVFGTLFFGIGVALLAIANDSFGTGCKLDKLGGLTLGIYTSHLLIIKYLDSLGLMPNSGIAGVILVVILSITFVALASKTPVIRRLV